MTTDELQALQKSFITTILKETQCVKDGAQYLYATSKLDLHCRVVFSEVLAMDEFAKSLLYHDNAPIRAQALWSVELPRLDALLAFFLNSDGRDEVETESAKWAAAQLCYYIGSEKNGLTVPERCSHYLLGLEALQNVKRTSFPKVLFVETGCCSRLMYYSGQRPEEETIETVKAVSLGLSLFMSCLA